MCVTVPKVSQGAPKKTTKTSQRAKFIAQVVGLLEPENRKVGQGFLTNVDVTLNVVNILAAGSLREVETLGNISSSLCT